MPDSNGAFKGHGWSRTYEAAYDRAFGNAVPAIDPDNYEVLPCSNDNEMCRLRGCVPHEAPDENLADRQAAEDDGWSREDYDQERSAGPPVRFEPFPDEPNAGWPPM